MDPLDTRALKVIEYTLDIPHRRIVLTVEGPGFYEITKGSGLFIVTDDELHRLRQQMTEERHRYDSALKDVERYQDCISVLKEVFGEIFKEGRE